MDPEEREDIFERAYNQESLPGDREKIGINILLIIKNDAEPKTQTNQL